MTKTQYHNAVRGLSSVHAIIVFTITSYTQICGPLDWTGLESCKTERFGFKGGCGMYVAKCLKENLA